MASYGLQINQSHGENSLSHIINCISPGHIAIITFNHPLFSLAKLVQEQFTATHDKGRYAAMLGVLHTEKAFWNLLAQ